MALRRSRQRNRNDSRLKRGEERQDVLEVLWCQDDRTITDSRRRLEFRSQIPGALIDLSPGERVRDAFGVLLVVDEGEGNVVGLQTRAFSQDSRDSRPNQFETPSCNRPWP